MEECQKRAQANRSCPPTVAVIRNKCCKLRSARTPRRVFGSLFSTLKLLLFQHSADTLGT